MSNKTSTHLHPPVGPTKFDGFAEIQPPTPPAPDRGAADRSEPPLGAGPERYVTGAELERVHDAANALREAATAYAEAADLSDPQSAEDGRWLAAADERLLSAARAWVASLPLAAPSARAFAKAHPEHPNEP
jgi:hypothetical protein